MYRWYEAAGLCIAYLSDVEDGPLPPEAGASAEGPGSLSRSEWFRRGWTLQELLAPAEVLFYDAKWRPIGTKSDMQLELGAITKIPSRYLRGSFRAKPRPCVAKIMSWTASRGTTRVEDRAYSLMGLFNVNMPLLYGEGRKAFLRLQLEILEKTDDESIFAWSLPAIDGLSHWGLLAPWPEAFNQSTGIERFRSDSERPAYKMTNKGLKIRMPALQYENQVERPEDGPGVVELPDRVQALDAVYFVLYCYLESYPEKSTKRGHEIAVSPYIRLEWDGRDWRRTDFDVLRTIPTEASHFRGRLSRAIYVKQPYLHMIRI